MSVRALALALALGVAPGTVVAQAPAAPDDAALMALGKKLTVWFFEGQADSLYAHLSDGAKANAGGVEGIRQHMSDFSSRAGSEMGVLVEKMTRRNGKPQFWHEGTFSNFPDALVIRWVFNDRGEVDGVGMGPKSGTPEPDAGS
ncbi:MAG: hypothetical protein IPK12_01385 [Gemmatimonadetes bacterium]|nr:hypothetical protein [Gemmatimonadota bacterium]